MPDRKTVLIHPPFCMPDKPYISTAVLYSYLSSQGVDVAVFDMNIEFYREYLSLSNIRKGLDHCEKRFHSLDNSLSMNNLEIREYLELVKVKRRMSASPPPFHLLFENGVLTNVEQFMLFSLSLDIVNTLHFPESLKFLQNTEYIRYYRQGSNFSSHSIVDSIKKTSLYSTAVTRIVFEYFHDELPDIVGISVSFPDQILPALYAANIIKKMNPKSHVCLGGTFISSHLREMNTLQFFDHIDSFILDEGENPLLELIRCLSESRSYTHIPGLIFKRGDQIVKNEPLAEQKSTLPMPDYRSVDLTKYLVSTGSMALLFRLSRGCYWHQCSFCRTQLSFVKNYLEAGVGQITSWIVQLVEHTPVRLLHLTDDAADPEMLQELSRNIIQKALSISWITNMRFDARISREKLESYKNAGCRMIFFGLESCNTRILKKMKKGISMKSVESTLRSCAEVGIPVHLYMIVGFPTETVDEARKTFTTVYKWKKSGVVKQVVYNVFEISGWSDIASNNEAYGVSDAFKSSTLDLAPPVSDFTCSGMDRSTARALCQEFITELSCLDSYSQKDLLSLYSKGRNQEDPTSIKTQYNTHEIMKEIEKLSREYGSKEVQFAEIPSFSVTR